MSNGVGWLLDADIFTMLVDSGASDHLVDGELIQGLLHGA